MFDENYDLTEAERSNRYVIRSSNLAPVLETTDLPTNVLIELKNHLGEDVQTRRIDTHRNRAHKWLCTGRDNSQRLLLKRLGLKEAREARVYERVLRACNLPVPYFWGAVEEATWTWLILEYIDGHAPVAERDFADLAIGLSALHSDRHASALLTSELQVSKACFRYATIGERSLRSLNELARSRVVDSSTHDRCQRLIRIADWQAEAAWLASGGTVPVHGNLHLGNVLVRWIIQPGSSQIALIDWPDMMLGSPLEDLGTLAAAAPGRMELIRIAYADARACSIDAGDLRRAFRFQLFVEIAWRATLVLKFPESGEIREFHARASLFGI